MKWINEFKPKDDSKNWASTNDPKQEYKYPPCPGCGGPVELNDEIRRYVCFNCGNDWEAWELLDNH